MHKVREDADSFKMVLRVQPAVRIFQQKSGEIFSAAVAAVAHSARDTMAASTGTSLSRVI